jgi:hypothetical protein
VRPGWIVVAVLLFAARAYAPTRSEPAASASSMEASDTSAVQAFDGDMNTRWASAWSDPQWIRIDLREKVEIHRVRLFWETAFARAYQIQVSNDAVQWTTLYQTTTGNGDTDDLLVSGAGRYVRMNGTARGTAYGYSLWEIEIYTGAGKSVSGARNGS